MKNNMTSSINQSDSERRYRRLCQAGRLVCLLAGIGLSVGAIACLVMSISDFVKAPSPGKTRPDDAFISEGKVGDSKCGSYIAFGENYSWPIPQLRINHHSYSTITGVDEAQRSRTWMKNSETSCEVVAWQRPSIAEQQTDILSATQDAGTEHAIPELFYPGLSHAPCEANAEVTSRPLIALDTVFKLCWYAVCLFVGIQMYRLFTHCLSGSILDRAALRTCKKILICYTAMLFFGPLSLYVFNLIASSGVAHIMSIPYAGGVLWLVLYSMYALMDTASHLKSEVEATI